MSSKPFSFTYILHWSPDHNVPILNPHKAHRFSSFFLRIRLTEPGDVRPASMYDILTIREAIYREFNDWKVVNLLIPENSVVLLNKIPGYPDEADEVIVNGELIGHRWYDPIEHVWRFRPILYGASKILDNKVGYYAIVDLPKLSRGFEVHRDKIVSAELPPRKGMIVVVSTRDGKWHGIARLVRSRRLYIIKAWRSVKSHYIDVKATIKDILEINEEELESMYSKSIKFLKSVFEKYRNRKVVVSYSGGKDSLVVLDLVNDILKDYYVIFNDTTLELPDTYKNIFEVANRYGIDIIIARARTNFFKILKSLLLPSRDFRYCCKMLKLAPISQTLKRIAPTGSLSITGQRKYESSLRARLPQISTSRWVANTVVVAPINDWTSLHVWLYIYWRRLPYNKAYDKGFDRIGCWICPANEISEIELACRHYQNLSDIFNRVLEILKLNNVDDICRICGLWRWRQKIPGDVKRFLESKFKKVDIESIHSKYIENALPISVRKFNSKFMIYLRRVLDDIDICIDRLLKFLYTLKDVSEVCRDRNIIHIHTAKLDIDIKYSVENLDSVSIELEFNNYDFDIIVQIFRVLARSFYCSKCGLCESWCSRSAIYVDSNIDIIFDRCSRCGLCNIVCPIAEYLISRSGILKIFKA